MSICQFGNGLKSESNQTKDKKRKKTKREQEGLQFKMDCRSLIANDVDCATKATLKAFFVENLVRKSRHN